ncbi:hypothetical protein [Paramagnetospirillum magneticum]|uniref:HTH iclR-type domain-containing protein n=1 Tax=Paramagnetospirillum magneticum (strain ATCC 700264 / AMB-1) TaxID=342108 RepID=Q2WA73_PARM1|nr:hypothetical protein [Paramagnetospirillum magneticum]BAE49252.1 hypothetical protein amb0448 [Paramagnetospirillum magneticum AMB-1]
MHPGRKPVHLVAAGGKPQGRQGIWEAIRAARESFTLPGLVAATDIHRDTVRSYLRGLEAAGYIVALDRPNFADGATKVYQLVRDVGVEAPRVTRDGKPVTQGAAQEQMWRTMKMIRGDFSWRDLAIAAATAETPVAEEAAKDYCANLAKAGYLAVVTVGKGVVGAGKAGGVPTRYRFNRAKNTGPKPPMVQRVNSVFDPNLRRVVWIEEVRHDG